MKRLALLRHAKSDWGDPALRDFDRPLNARGRAAAIRMGAELARLGLAFDLALVSPARRAADTFERLCRAWQGAVEVRREPRLYGAPAETLLAIAAGTPRAARSLLLVGHNPGLHDLALRFVGEDPGELAVKLPTGSLVEVALEAEEWADIEQAAGRLVRFLRPRDLDQD